MPGVLDTKSKSYHLLSWCWPLHLLVLASSILIPLFHVVTVFQLVSYPGPFLYLYLYLYIYFCVLLEVKY